MMRIAAALRRLDPGVEDAAAALLSIDDATGDVAVSTSDTGEEDIPGGSTLMEMPIFTPPGQGAKDTGKQAPGAEKATEQKPDAKKPAAGAAQDAAKTILDKMRQGKRK